MAILEMIKQINWSDSNRKIAVQLFDDAISYMKRVEDHIYKGNEIRADSFMDISEKQDELRRLDKKRTEAHDKMLESFKPFLDLLREQTDFQESDFNLANRTRIADFVAEIIFEMLGMEPTSRREGDVRDELAEKLHNKEITNEQIELEITNALSQLGTASQH